MLISFRIEWCDFLAVQGPLKSLFQQHNSKRTILQWSVLFMIKISHLYMKVTQSSSALWTRGLPHARLPCQSPTPRVYSNSCPLSRWCPPTISSSVIPFSSCLQSFPASGLFPVSQFFASGGQSIEASASVFSMSIQDWFPLGLTDLISLLSKELSRLFNTTVWRHQFFGTQSSLWSSSHIHTWLL